MQLDRELIDVAGHFSPLRVVLFQFAAQFLGIGKGGLARTFRRRHQRLLTAFLAGEIHSRRRFSRDQRRFAMLAVKENIRVALSFTKCARVGLLHEVKYEQGLYRRSDSKPQIPSSKSQANAKHSNPKTARTRAALDLDFGTWNLFGIWNLGFGISGAP